VTDKAGRRRPKWVLIGLAVVAFVCCPSLKAGADVNLQGASGETALIMAASGRGDTIGLLANGVDPTIADRNDKTALIWLTDE
jgi:hypothetical protein